MNQWSSKRYGSGQEREGSTWVEEDDAEIPMGRSTRQKARL